MPVHIALLRGINVGGRNLVAMSDLRDMCAALELSGARTLLQSGNLVFQSKRATGKKLEQFLETETEKRLGAAVHYFVRTTLEWQDAIVRNPFPAEAERDPGHLIVLFLKESASAKDVEALRAAIRGREVVGGEGRELYLVYPDGMGTSKLTNAVIERTLGQRGTARNWNTVLKIAEIARATGT
jgi:uncharacterized protein (DUF1697 family)